jgi:hypothetical protein
MPAIEGRTILGLIQAPMRTPNDVETGDKPEHSTRPARTGTDRHGIALPPVSTVTSKSAIPVTRKNITIREGVPSTDG